MVYDAVAYSSKPLPRQKSGHPITDNTAYNHYSLLRSYEDAFGLSCIMNACDTTDGVRPGSSR
jgi:hypothetical protein